MYEESQEKNTDEYVVTTVKYGNGPVMVLVYSPNVKES